MKKLLRPTFTITPTLPRTIDLRKERRRGLGTNPPPPPRGGRGWSESRPAAPPPSWATKKSAARQTKLCINSVTSFRKDRIVNPTDKIKLRDGKTIHMGIHSCIPSCEEIFPSFDRHFAPQITPREFIGSGETENLAKIIRYYAILCENYAIFSDLQTGLGKLTGPDRKNGNLLH